MAEVTKQKHASFSNYSRAVLVAAVLVSSLSLFSAKAYAQAVGPVLSTGKVLGKVNVGGRVQKATQVGNRVYFEDGSSVGVNGRVLVIRKNIYTWGGGFSLPSRINLTGHEPQRSAVGLSGHEPQQPAGGMIGHEPQQPAGGLSGHEPQQPSGGLFGHEPQ